MTGAPPTMPQCKEAVTGAPGIGCTDGFGVIYCDPPWRYDFAETDNRAIEAKYPTMSLEELCALKVPAAKNSVLYLWATAPKLLEASLAGRAPTSYHEHPQSAMTTPAITPSSTNQAPSVGIGCDALVLHLGGHQNQLPPAANKFHVGNGSDGKHYWLTPPDLMAELQQEFRFDFDPCPCPKPEDFDGLTCEWGQSNYVNPPFGSIMHQGPGDKKPKKKGPTAWARKAILEHRKGKQVVLVYPVDKWLLMLLAAGAKVRNLGDVRWHATEDGSKGKGTGRHIAAFILENTTMSHAHSKNPTAPSVGAPSETAGPA